MSLEMERAGKLLHMLSEKDLGLASEFLTRLIKKWDPDFTKVTSSEKKQIEEAEKDFSQGEYYTDDDVWN